MIAETGQMIRQIHDLAESARFEAYEGKNELAACRLERIEFWAKLARKELGYPAKEE